MPDRSIAISRRRLLGGLATVGAASVATGAGTMAAFSDTESSSNNDIAAGTLDLSLDGASETVTFLDESDITPGDSDSDSVTVGSEGSVGGRLAVTIDTIENLDKQGNEGGNLAEFLAVQASIANEDAFDSPTTVDQLSEGDELFTDIELEDTDRTFELAWELRDGNGVNKAKGHRVTLDFTFRLESSGSV